MSINTKLSRPIDLSPPSPGLNSAALNEFLEVLQIPLHASGKDTQQVTNLFNRALRLVLHLQHHPGFAIAEAMEGDDTRVLFAA